MSQWWNDFPWFQGSSSLDMSKSLRRSCLSFSALSEDGFSWRVQKRRHLSEAFFCTAVRWDLSQSQAVRGFLTDSKLYLIKLWWVLTLLLPFRKKVFNKGSWHYYFHILEASSVLLKRLKKIIGVVSDKDTDFYKENQVKEGQVFLHSYQGLFGNFCIRYHFDFWKCF